MIFADLGIMTTLFWNRFMVVGSTGMPIAFFGFAQNFLRKERQNWLYIGLVSYLIAQIANIMGYVIKDAYLVDGLLHNDYGLGVYVISITWAFFFGFLSYDLLLEYRSSKDPLYRNRLKYLLIVTVLTFLGSLTNATELQVLPVDIAFNALSALLITYAIVRHRLLDISVVVRKGLLYSVPTIIVGAGYFLIISLALNIFQIVSGPQIFILSLIVAVIAALVAQPLRERAQSWIDKLFFREKYDSSLMLQRISSAAASVLDLDRLTSLILDEVTSILHIQTATFFIKQDDSEDYFLIAQKGLNLEANLTLGDRHPIVLWLTANKGILTKSDVDVLPQFRALWGREMDKLAAITAEIFIPLIVNENLVGLLTVGPKLSGEPYSYDDQLTLKTLANQTAVAIEKARLYAVAQRELSEREYAERRLQLQLHRLNALHAIDVSIATTVNLNTTLKVLLDQVTSQLGVDAAAVLLLNSGDKILKYRASRGFRTAALQHTRLLVGEGLAGLAAQNQSVIHVPDISKMQTSLNNSPLLSSEGFITYFGVPIIAKGQVKGVLEIFHRTELEPDPEWLDFMETLATEAAIIVDNVSLFNDLQQTNFELEQAYETTLAGWASALELRDKETVGHSRRVKEMTVLLARYLGVQGDDLVHIRRGALLHDIGKMGIPDELLSKPGPLTQEEIDIMAQHPVYAYDLLSTIPFLTPALDIPYSHHEKWDGTGYPQGLKGEEIPLAARIFAVVDVWDALLSDRSYRSAWAIEEVLKYIRDQSGKHFDPKVIEAFFKLVDEMKLVELVSDEVGPYASSGS